MAKRTYSVRCPRLRLSWIRCLYIHWQKCRVERQLRSVESPSNQSENGLTRRLMHDHSVSARWIASSPSQELLEMLSFAASCQWRKLV